MASDTMVVHRSVLQGLDDAGDGGSTLSAGDVDADDVAALLVDDRIDRDSCLTGLSVADDQFALTTTDGGHRVDRFDTGLQWLLHRLTLSDARSHELDRTAFAVTIGPLPSSGLPRGSMTRPIMFVADGDGEQFARRLDLVTFLNGR